LLVVLGLHQLQPEDLAIGSRDSMRALRKIRLHSLLHSLCFVRSLHYPVTWFVRVSSA